MLLVFVSASIVFRGGDELDASPRDDIVAMLLLRDPNETQPGMRNRDCSTAATTIACATARTTFVTSKTREGKWLGEGRMQLGEEASRRWAGGHDLPRFDHHLDAQEAISTGGSTIAP